MIGKKGKNMENENDVAKRATLKAMMLRLVDLLQSVDLNKDHDKSLFLLTSVIMESLPIDYLSSVLSSVKKHTYELAKPMGGVAEQFSQTEMSLAKVFMDLCEKEMTAFRTSEALAEIKEQARGVKE
jgi:hypothetical protein